MIVPGQQNLKVHFATAEHVHQFACSVVGGNQYHLFTAYPFLAERAGITGGVFQLGAKVEPMAIPRFIQRASRHTIMDSGLFTLMFGAKAGKKDAAFIDRWQDLLVEFARATGFEGSCVEVDCQKVLGPEHAWRLRERMRRQLPTNRIINVFHKEDGQAGLDRLIEFSDYIALSIPELRVLGQSGYTERLAHYVKNRKPEIDIHLLGCTEMKLLKSLSFCTTSDSSSWTSCVRYGWMDTVKGKIKLEHFMASPRCDDYERRFVAYMNTLGAHYTAPRRNGALAFAAEQARVRYATAAGPQD